MLVLLRNSLQSQVSWKSCPWVTDYSGTVWAAKRFPKGQQGLVCKDVEFEKENGKSGTAHVEFKWQERMNFKGDQSAFSSDHIAAINALVSHHVSAEKRSHVMQVSANKFYIQRGWSQMGGIGAFRGYFISVRSGDNKLLLNVNTITTPFMLPIPVSQLMTTLNGHREYTLRSVLKGVRVRIMYDRIKRRDDYDPNSPQNRMKVIHELGRVPARQPCTEHEPATVYEHFTGPGATIREPELECVNIGNLKNPIWIPPEFVEIDLWQQFRSPLSGSHITYMIRYAVRTPAAYAALIIQEGIADGYLGIRTPGKHMVGERHCAYLCLEADYFS